MAVLRQLQYVGGPFDGGAAPDDFIDRIDMQGPAGSGTYARTLDEESGVTVYRWEPRDPAGQTL
jgi:hypothetical protein